MQLLSFEKPSGPLFVRQGQGSRKRSAA